MTSLNCYAILHPLQISPAPCLTARRGQTPDRNNNGRKPQEGPGRRPEPDREAVWQGLGHAHGRCRHGAQCGSHLHRFPGPGYRPRRGWRAQGPGGGNLRARVLGQDYPHPAHHRRGPEAGRYLRLRRCRARPGPGLRQMPGRQHGRTAGLPAGHRRAGPGDHRHAGALRGGGRGSGGLGGGPDPQGRDRGRDGRLPRRPSGAPDVPGPAQAHRQHQALQLPGGLHQSDPHEDRRHVRQPGDHHRG